MRFEPPYTRPRSWDDETRNWEALRALLKDYPNAREIDTTGLTSADVDALFPSGVPFGLLLMDSLNSILLYRDATGWRTIASTAL